jgi:hypothetical protein
MGKRTEDRRRVKLPRLRHVRDDRGPASPGRASQLGVVNKTQNRTHPDANVEASASPVLGIADYFFGPVDSPLKARGQMSRQGLARQVYEVIRIEGAK